MRVLHRCPEWLPDAWDPWMKHPKRTMMLTHPRGLTLSAGLARVYSNQAVHDPSDLDAARRMAASTEPIPVGILYRDSSVPCYEDLRRSEQLRTPEYIREGFEAELDKFTVWPQGASPGRPAS